MNRSSLLLLFFVSVLASGCSTYSSTPDKRDFAVDTYFISANEMQMAERHARQYWQKNVSRFGTEPRYLAVTASSILAAELSAEFSVKLDRSETSGAYFTQGISSSSKQGLHGIMLFDTQTDRSVGSQGYILVDTPSRGQVIHLAQYTARYIGGG
jgi:hypothetical protein